MFCLRELSKHFSWVLLQIYGEEKHRVTRNDALEAFVVTTIQESLLRSAKIVNNSEKANKCYQLRIKIYILLLLICEIKIVTPTQLKSNMYL